MNEESNPNSENAKSRQESGAVDHAPENAKTTDTAKKNHTRKPLSRFQCFTLLLASLGILVAAGTGVAIFWQAWVGARTLTAIQQQNRPWVGFSGQMSLSEASSESRVFKIVVGYTLKNFGNSPALNTVTFLEAPLGEANNYALTEMFCP
jgi:hypothetical protein